MDILIEHLITSEDLLKISHKGRYELIEGVVNKMSPSGEKHGFIASKIGFIVSKYVYENKLGITTGAETGYKLSENPDTVKAPDLAFKSSEKVIQGGIADNYSSVMPELVVEVNSPSDSYVQVMKKVNLWISAGVKQVWVIDSEDKAVAVYDSEGRCKIFDTDQYLTGGEILPGFKCNVREIFEF